MERKEIYRWWLPLASAGFLFLCIRLVTDITRHTLYWEGKNGLALLTDTLPIVAGSYIAFFWLFTWMKWSRKRSLRPWQEYGGLLCCVWVLCLLIMYGSRWLNLSPLRLDDVVIALVISSLQVGLLYALLKNRAVRKENERQQLQMEKMRNDQLQTELKFLKAQYHPHFLFNALNTIYFQIDKSNDAPRRTIEILSELLRYQLYDEGRRVRVADEIGYLKRYIRLWQLRSTERLKLELHFDERLQGQQLYPLLFVPLVENAFKYVGGDYRIVLRMEWQAGQLSFRLMNTVALFPLPPSKRKGIGLENLKRRLELLYPKRHTLQIEKEKNSFTVELIIQLENDAD